MTSSKGKAAPAYGTGRSESLASGYVRVWEPGHPLAGADGYVYEHRKVVYDAGIAVPPGYEVHHQNEVRSDNRLENLEVRTGGDHHAVHHEVGMKVTNQYGTFVVLTPEERLVRSRERGRENQRKRRAGLRFDEESGSWR